MVSRVRFVGGVLLLGVGCAPAAPAPVDDEPTSDSEATLQEPRETQSATVVPAPSLVRPAFDCSKAAPATRVEQVCWRWHCDGDATAKSTWSGRAATCDAGALDAETKGHALRRINAHRFLADLEPFTEERAWSNAAQECALIADANAKLSHEPPRDWACWSALGAEVSRNSLVANVAVVPSIAAYIEDPGNETTMVHRRWLLDETIASVGFGSTERYSCVVVHGGSVGKPSSKPKNVRGWAAWPPAGPVPMDVFETEKLDTAGWTVQSTEADLEDVVVKVSSEGKNMPIAVTQLTAGQGSRSAIRFVPKGWVTEAGRTYAVDVRPRTATAARIEFEVKAIACGE